MLKKTAKNRQKFNKCFAIFMGVYTQGQVENWDYDVSWSCLMPVVEKIESMESTIVEILGKNCEIQPIFTSASGDRLIWHKRIKIGSDTKQAAVYEAAYWFIEWYNGFMSKKNTKTAKRKSITVKNSK